MINKGSGKIWHNFLHIIQSFRKTSVSMTDQSPECIFRTDCLAREGKKGYDRSVARFYRDHMNKEADYEDRRDDVR